MGNRASEEAHIVCSTTIRFCTSQCVQYYYTVIPTEYQYTYCPALDLTHAATVLAGLSLFLPNYAG
jgi:hypothetical protein